MSILTDGKFDEKFDGAGNVIEALQNPDGSIPWFKNGVIDPWNHLEAAMGLNLIGRRDAAERAISFLRNTQAQDGSWWGQLGSAVPIDDELHQFTMQGVEDGHKIRDTNFIAYIATAIWHHLKLHDEIDYAAANWPMVKAAIDFVVALQSPDGDIRWSAPDPQTPEDDALITGNSSIHKSLICAEKLADRLGHDAQSWARARAKLADALAHKPHRYDRTWAPKTRYSMDWYYPVLSGALSSEQETERLAARWSDFVIDGFGCRCVDDQPWVTVAESAELAMALMAHGDTARAETHLSWLDRFRDENGAYWMGMQVEDRVFWPVERPAWTSGAVILAHDAVLKLSPAHGVLTGRP
ncbi:MAG: prenyltransferase [Alphaproteobacteria bacterium]|nr:prenyltransferase [Alphaproteobacteria bacterium]